MPRVTLTKEQRAAVYESDGGKCHIHGEHVPPLGSWSVVEGHLLCPECNELRGNRSLDELRVLIVRKRAEARDFLSRYKGGALLVPAADSSGNGVPEE